MKTLVECGLQPKVGMIVMSLSRQTQYNILAIEPETRYTDKHFVLLSERYTIYRVKEDHLINKFSLVGYSYARFQDFFKSTFTDYQTMVKEELLKSLTNIINNFSV